MQKLVAITSYFMHRFTHNLNLGWVSTWMTLTYILPSVPNRNAWKLCQFIHVVNYMPIIIHVSQKKLGRRGTLDPTGQLVISRRRRRPGDGRYCNAPRSSVCPSVRLSVRLSVRPSVTFSFRTVTQKRIAVFSRNFAGTCTKWWGCAV